MKIEIHPQFGPLNSKPIFDAFIKSVKIVDNGFRYTSSNPPDINFRSH